MPILIATLEQRYIVRRRFDVTFPFAEVGDFLSDSQWAGMSLDYRQRFELAGPFIRHPAPRYVPHYQIEPLPLP